MSEMAGNIMSSFTQFTLKEIMWELTIKQFFALHSLSMKHKYNIPIKGTRSNKKAEEINNKFEWDEKKNRWV